MSGGGRWKALACDSRWDQIATVDFGVVPGRGSAGRPLQLGLGCWGVQSLGIGAMRLENVGFNWVRLGDLRLHLHALFLMTLWGIEMTISLTSTEFRHHFYHYAGGYKTLVAGPLMPRKSSVPRLACLSPTKPLRNLESCRQYQPGNNGTDLNPDRETSKLLSAWISITLPTQLTTSPCQSRSRVNGRGSQPTHPIR